MRMLIALFLAALPTVAQAQECDVEDWKHRYEPTVAAFLAQGA